MACFADINVSEGSVSTHARCGGIFNIHLTNNLPKHLLVKNFLKSVQVWRNCGHESVATLFGPPCVWCYDATYRSAWLWRLSVCCSGPTHRPRHICSNRPHLARVSVVLGGSVAEWLACLTQRAEGPGFKSQPRCCLRQTVHTNRACVHEAAKLAAALLGLRRIAAGLALIGLSRV